MHICKLTMKFHGNFIGMGEITLNIDYGKMAYIPEISFEVGTNDENEETVSRSAGMLKALAVALKPDGNSIIEGSGTALFATAA